MTKEIGPFGDYAKKKEFCKDLRTPCFLPVLTNQPYFTAYLYFRD